MTWVSWKRESERVQRPHQESERVQYMYFEKLKKRQSMMDESKIACQVSSKRCLITFIEEDNFADAIQFVDYISGL